MFKFIDNNQVVARYRFSVLGVFIAIVITAVLLASYRYSSELELFEQQELKTLDKQAFAINAELSKAVDATFAIQRFANYTLNSPEELGHVPKLKQDGNLFFLDKEQHDVTSYRLRLSANITGVGKISEFDEKLRQELAMASMLTSAFVAAQSNVKVANWFSYISLQHFVSLYPWIDKESWHYSDRIIQRNYFTKLGSMHSLSNKLVWSDPYVSTSGNSLYMALAGGVYLNEALTGAVALNIDLASLHKLLSETIPDKHQYLLINQNDQLLFNLTQDSTILKEKVDWQSVLPTALQSLNYEMLTRSTGSFIRENWLVQQSEIANNGWRLIKIQPHDEFTHPIFERVAGMFLLVLLGQLSLLVVIYLVTRKTFIKPTQQFIDHISFSAKGDHGKVSPPNGWHQWFSIVGDIFSQNRSLLQQLKDQNNILDSRVIEKTKALTIKSQQHQHDYAILRSVMDAIPDYLIFSDAKGKVIGCNAAFENFIDKKESNILGLKTKDLLNNELSQALSKSADNDHQYNHHQGIFKVIETTDSTYEFFVSDFYSHSLDILGSIAVIRDVTEQHAATAALALAKEQAEFANQAKSQFLANMSHEIRTPINAIQGMQYLLENTPLTNQQKQHLSNATNASTALLHLVDELLDLAKIESGNMSITNSPCRLDSIINQAIKLNIGSINPNKVVLDVVIEPEVPSHVISDEMRLIQVLSNLLNNAIKFTHEGSVVLKVVVVGSNDTDSLVRFTVADTGIGIAKSKQAHLFEAFMQADESMTREYGGSGLGLSICQKIVKLLGGKITIESDEDEGSEFSFILPLRASELETAQQVESCTTFAKNYQPTESLIRLLESKQYKHQQLVTFVGLADELEDGNNVIFLSIDEITKENCQVIADEILSVQSYGSSAQRCIIAICQSANDNNEFRVYQLLNEYKIPYQVCEYPLFRYGLTNIVDSLSLPEALLANMAGYEEAAASSLTVESKTDLLGINVLLVEDNLVNQMVAKELLKSLSAQVTIAENGQRALEIIKEGSFDVVLMDIQMPVMDGLTATKLIRQQAEYKELPIIAMTAHARQEDQDNSLAAGMNLHVAKPVKADMLSESILSVVTTKH